MKRWILDKLRYTKIMNLMQMILLAYKKLNLTNSFLSSLMMKPTSLKTHMHLIISIDTSKGHLDEPLYPAKKETLSRPIKLPSSFPSQYPSRLAIPQPQHNIDILNSSPLANPKPPQVHVKAGHYLLGHRFEQSALTSGFNW